MYNNPDSGQRTADTSLLLDGELSKRIHSLRFLLIVFVVFIHNTVIDRGVNFSDGKQTFEVPPCVAKARELSGCFTDTAVPLFFLISGFLLFIKEPEYLENLKKKCRTILLPYTLWTVLVILFLFAAQSFSFTKQYFANFVVRNFSPMDWLGAFAGYFGRFHDGSLNGPLLYHFWFLRDLFVLNLLFVPVKKIVDFCPGAAFVSFFLFWTGGINLYIVNPGALFFFALGYYMVKYRINYRGIDSVKTSGMAAVYLVTITAKLFFREKIPAVSCVNILAGIAFFVKLSHDFTKNEKMYRLLAWLEQYSFWVYAAHGTVLAAMIKLSVKIMPMNGAWLLVHYFAVTLLCVFVLAGTGMIFKKLFPKIFSVLTGGR